MKEKQHMIIAFDEASFEDIAKLLEIEDFKCKFCKVNITKENVGGFVHPKMVFCNNSFCLIKHIQEHDAKKEVSKEK